MFEQLPVKIFAGGGSIDRTVPLHHQDPLGPSLLVVNPVQQKNVIFPVIVILGGVKVGGAGRSVRLFCIDLHALGLQNVAVIRSREVAVNQGFLKYYSEWSCSWDQGKCPL